MAALSVFIHLSLNDCFVVTAPALALHSLPHSTGCALVLLSAGCFRVTCLGSLNNDFILWETPSSI